MHHLLSHHLQSSGAEFSAAGEAAPAAGAGAAGRGAPFGVVLRTNAHASAAGTKGVSCTWAHDLLSHDLLSEEA